jgi:hypothetical protein
MPNIGQVYVTQNSTTRPRADDHLPSARRLRRCAPRPCLVLPSGSAYSMSNETYLPPTFAIAWTPIRISGTSRMSMAMGNGKTIAWVRPSTTPRRCTSMRALTFEKLAYIAPGPLPPISATSISTTVTPLTTAGDSTPRRLLTDDDRRRMCEYHESHLGN